MSRYAGHDVRSDPILNRLGANIRILRQGAGWTVGRLALEVGSNARSIYDYERGETRMPVDTLVRIAALFDVSLDDLVHGAPLFEGAALQMAALLDEPDCEEEETDCSMTRFTIEGVQSAEGLVVGGEIVSGEVR
jgi:transcriptional regulator with XRE-family HTH domain